MKKVPLRLILVVPFILQIVIAVGLTGFISLKNGEKAVKDLASQLRNEVSGRISEHLNDYLAKPHKINQATIDALNLGLIHPQDMSKIGKFFWKQVKLNEVSFINYGLKTGEFAGAGYIESFKEGIAIAETSAETNWKPHNYATDSQGNRTDLAVIYDEFNHQEEAWYIDAIRANKPVWSQVYFWDGTVDKINIISIAAARPLYDEKGEIIGAIGVDLLLTNITDFLRQLNVSPNGKSFILEKNGLLIASNSKEPPFKIVNGQSQRLEATETQDSLIKATAQHLQEKVGNLSFICTKQETEFFFDNQRQFVQITPWKDEYGLNWLVVVVVPENDFMEKIQANTRITIILCLLALVVAIVVGIITSHYLVEPILKTIKAAESLSKGKWNSYLSESASKELTLLAKVFNRMAKQLQDSFARLEYQANHDSLTGLLNQRAFKLKLEKTIEAHESYNKAKNEQNIQYFFAVLFLDLDYFKFINDSFGHYIGDLLLIAVSNRLKESISLKDTLGRFGGDEFIILVDNIIDENQAIETAEIIIQELESPFDIEGTEIFITCSIGIVFSSSNLMLINNYIRNADIALYHAKAKGKATYEIFDAEMYTEMVRRVALLTDLKRALEKNELMVYYQPIININTKQITGFEALMRWRHSQKGMISPGEFIPIAEETGLIVSLGWWITKQACHQMKLWQDKIPACESMTMSVNLSAKQFFQKDIMEQIETILLETGLKHSSLKLEITESIFINHWDLTIAKLKKLKQLGIQFSLDDFGTGYSSLSYLQRFPFNTLKIDRSFVNRLDVNSDDVAIIQAITNLANSLGMDVVAEGVETQKQLEILRTIGCEKCQGYLFAPALIPEEVEQLLTARLLN